MVITIIAIVILILYEVDSSTTFAGEMLVNCAHHLPLRPWSVAMIAQGSPGTSPCSSSPSVRRSPLGGEDFAKQLGYHGLLHGNLMRVKHEDL